MSKVLKITLKNKKEIYLIAEKSVELNQIANKINNNNCIHDGKIGVMSDEISTFELLDTIKEVKE